MLAPWKKSYDKPKQHKIKQRHYFGNKGPIVKATLFPVDINGCEKVKKVKVLVTQLCLTLVTPWTAARQAPLSRGFSRQEY